MKRINITITSVYVSTREFIRITPTTHFFKASDSGPDTGYIPRDRTLNLLVLMYINNSP